LRDSSQPQQKRVLERRELVAIESAGGAIPHRSISRQMSKAKR
jgi:hypothetical protein